MDSESRPIYVVYPTEESRPFGMKHESCDPWIPICDQPQYTTRNTTPRGPPNCEDMAENCTPSLNMKIAMATVVETQATEPMMVTPRETRIPINHYPVLNSPVIPYTPPSSGINPSERIIKEEQEAFDATGLGQALMNHSRRGSGIRSKIRTPRTLTRLMQQHRENERHRHRGLNASINEISKRIPGFEEAFNETKIVKLQRIINYICHLEGNIHEICKKIGWDFDFKHLFLSPNVQMPFDEKKVSTMTQSNSYMNEPSKRQSCRAGKRLSPENFIRELEGLKRNRIPCSMEENMEGEGFPKPRRSLRARSLRTTGCATVTKATSKGVCASLRSDSDIEDDPDLREVCQDLQAAGTLTPEVEQSMEWLRNISPSPDHSLSIIEEEEPQDRADLRHSNWNKHGGSAITKIGTCTERLPRTIQETVNQPLTNQMIKLEPMSQKRNPNSGKPIIHFACTESDLCGDFDQFQVSQVLEITDPLLIRKEHRAYQVRNVKRETQQRVEVPREVVAVPFTRPRGMGESADSAAPAVSTQLPFARYAVKKDAETSGPFQSLTDKQNAIYVQFQGLNCLTVNRGNVQTKRVREMIKDNPQILEPYREKDKETNMTVLKKLPRNRKQEVVFDSNSYIGQPDAENVRPLKKKRLN